MRARDAFFKTQESSPKLESIINDIETAAMQGRTCIIVGYFVYDKTKKELMDLEYLLTHIENQYTHEQDLKISWRK